MRRSLIALATAALLTLPTAAHAHTGWTKYGDHWIRYRTAIDRPTDDNLRAWSSYLQDRARAIKRARKANRAYKAWLAAQVVPGPTQGPSRGYALPVPTGPVADIIRAIFGVYGDKAVAVASCESGLNPQSVNPNGHYGLWQFSEDTWHGQGYSGLPIDYSATVQTEAAWGLFQVAGWGPWSCA